MAQSSSLVQVSVGGTLLIYVVEVPDIVDWWETFALQDAFMGCRTLVSMSRKNRQD